MKIHNIVLCAVLVTTSTAQINLSDILSEAQSLYTAVTSVLGGTPTTTASTSSRTTSSTSSSSTVTSSTSTSTSSASAAATPTTSAAARSTSASTTATAAAAAATTSTNNGSGGSGGIDTLPIVLGCTLGALALAAFLALLFLCRRRSKRNKTAAKHRALTSSDDESEIWNGEKSKRNSFKGPTEHTRSLGATNTMAAAPLMSHHQHTPGHYNLHGHSGNRDSYGPAPPNTRQVGFSPGVHDGGSTAYSVHPYSPDHVQHYTHQPEPLNKDYHGNSVGSGVVAGFGGAALGGMAAHAASKHNRRRSESRSRKVKSGRHDSAFSEDDPNTLPQTTIESSERRSGSVSRASVKEPWPFLDAHERRSTDSSRSRPRSMSRAQERFATPEPHPYDRNSMPSGAVLAGSAAVGGLLGTAAAHKADGDNPQRKGILKQTTPDVSSQSTSPDAEIAARQTTAYGSGPHELASAEIPPVMAIMRQREHSPLGTAAPAAAMGANHSPSRSRRRSWSSSTDRAVVPPISIPHESSRDSDIPHVPNRSPRRSSLHSNARYSTANEGTVELPGDDHDRNRTAMTNTDVVSPALEPHQGPLDSDGIISPISPDTSLPGTWSNAQARELGMIPTNAAAKSASQESTAVESTPLNSNSNSSSSTSSKDQSSGLVSAIQRIFNSQKQSWPVEDSHDAIPQPRRSLGDRITPAPINVYDDTDNRRISSVPHRKPAPMRESQHRSQYGEIDRNSIDASGLASTTAPLQQTTSRQSGESARSIPLNGGRYYARVNSMDGSDQTTVSPAATATTPAANASMATTTSMNTARPRSTSAGRSGYGLGSGDPFDLARVRTDSSMTGISLSNYVEPQTKTNTRAATVNTATATRPRAYRSSSSSNDYREPTLAELKREVEAEDRQRRASWKSLGRGRKSTEGQRYGDDAELFDLSMPGTEQFDHFYGQGYGHGQSRGAGVGRAF